MLTPAMPDDRRARLARIQRLRAELDARWSETTPLARQAAALDLARDEVPWLLEEIERLSEENESLHAQLDDCQEMLDSTARH
jgi:hypothetical protein